MSFLHIIAIAIGLGVDAMSVSMAVAVRWHGPGQRFRLAWHMGMFQFLMPLAGWLTGSALADYIAGVGCYVASALIIAVGAKMLYEAIKAGPGEVTEHAAEWEARHLGKGDPTRGWSLYVLSIATSIDALAVGISLGLRGQDIFFASVIIGIVAALMVLIGMYIGKRIGRKLGRPAELAGGVVLIILGILFLWI